MAPGSVQRAKQTVRDLGPTGQKRDRKDTGFRQSPCPLLFFFPTQASVRQCLGSAQLAPQDLPEAARTRSAETPSLGWQSCWSPSSHVCPLNRCQEPQLIFTYHLLSLLGSLQNWNVPCGADQNTLAFVAQSGGRTLDALEKWENCVVATASVSIHPQQPSVTWELRQKCR